MDKQGATDYILNRLQVGCGRAEIVDELSRTLKAQPAVVERFVDQVISNHPETAPPPQKPLQDDNPDKIEPLPILIEMHQTEAAPLLTNTDLPPGLQALINENSANIDAVPFVREMPDPVNPPQTNPDISLPRQAVFDPPAEKDFSSDIELERLGEFVFQQLRKQRRHNDVVEAVCNQTGWHWNMSQRFVARVQTKRYDELNSRKNRFIIVIGFGIILVGLIMALNGASAVADYARLAVSARTNPEILLNISHPEVVYAGASTVTGIGMIIGGGLGIARALSDR